MIYCLSFAVMHLRGDGPGSGPFFGKKGTCGESDVDIGGHETENNM